MSDVAHLLPKCPRCGYGLRMVRGYWWCDVCKASLAPQKPPSVREILKAAGDTLKRLFTPPPQRRPTFATSVPAVERGPTVARCPACGSLTPRDLPTCVHCGTRFRPPTEVTRPRAVPTIQPVRHDEMVYRYIVQNGGEISLSRASVDLGIGLPELQASIRRLEDSGKIMRDSSRNAG